MDIKKRYSLPSLSYRLVSDTPTKFNTGLFYYVRWNDGLEQWKSGKEIADDKYYTENLNKETVS